MSIIDKLKERRGFTETENSLATYILHHAEDIPRTSVGELAANSHVSKAAIIRLCQKLGLDGYRSLRVDLATELERRRSMLVDIDANRPFTSLESSATTIRTLAELESEAVNSCYESLSPQVIDEVAKDILEASSVVIYSLGDSCIVTQLFATKLAKLGIPCVVAGAFGDFNAYTALCGAGSLALFASYSGLFLRSAMNGGAIQRIKDLDCKTVIITGLSEGDPLLNDIDLVISFPRKESLGGAIGPFYSLTCLNFVLNCIYARVYATDFEKYDRIKAGVDTINRVDAGL